MANEKKFDWGILIQALAPIGVELVGRLIEAIQKDDASILTAEDWLALSINAKDPHAILKSVLALRHPTPPTP